MPPKKKLTRYDAAYDHLGPAGLGFPKRRKNSTIVELSSTWSSSAARTSNAIDIFEPTGYEPRTEEVKKRIEDNKYLLPTAEKESSQRKLAGLVAIGNDGGKLVSAQEKRPCFGLLDCEDDGEEEYVFSETKASVRERTAREGSVIPKEVQNSWWDVVGAA
ncbi:hypothetical protein MKX01_001934 [Papaver californicum]|nr:hypothetical protein MKX01_001934 [Papaver californicum]